MTDSYKEGYKEGVIFLFYDDGSILLEHRPIDDGTETFIPNGTIEERDKLSDNHDDYVVAALHREVDEELSGKVTVNSIDKLCEYQVEEPALWFYSYLVTDWDGEFPDHTVEDGEQYAELEWVPLDEYEAHLAFPSALETCKELKNHLEGGGK
jgi:8-oxo-dGTP pyrophosphatase MutT (NUDIX family)